MRTNKVDKGFEFFYWRLSYRRKFIRTLWLTPIDIVLLLLLLLLLLVWNLDNNISFKIIATIILILLTLTQLLYNYIKWKKGENNAN